MIGFKTLATHSIGRITIYMTCEVLLTFRLTSLQKQFFKYLQIKSYSISKTLKQLTPNAIALYSGKDGDKILRRPRSDISGI